MTKNQKYLLVGVGIVGVVLFLRRKASASPSGSAFFTELSLVNCNCFSTQFFRDGTTKSTKVPIERCIAEEDMADAAKQCNQKAADESLLGAAIFETLGEDIATQLGGVVTSVTNLFSTPAEGAKNPGLAT